MPYREGRGLVGTPRYASINNHRGIEQSRRDDIESIGYMLVYFLKGSLPWQGLKAKSSKEKYRLIYEKKSQVAVSELCAGCPQPFADLIEYARAMRFDAQPDLARFRKAFQDLYVSQGFAIQVCICSAEVACFTVIVMVIVASVNCQLLNFCLNPAVLL